MGLGHARTYLKGYLMAIEKTFIMIKPDAVRDRKIGEIVARIERSGLVIERMEMTTLERATVEEHYAHLADKPFFGSLCDFMTSGPVVKMVVSGENAVAVFVPKPLFDTVFLVQPGGDGVVPAAHRLAAGRVVI